MFVQYEAKVSGLGEVAGVFLSDKSGELEALRAGVFMLGDAGIGEDAKSSITMLQGEVVIAAEAATTSAA